MKRGAVSVEFLQLVDVASKPCANDRFCYHCQSAKCLLGSINTCLLYDIKVSSRISAPVPCIDYI